MKTKKILILGSTGMLGHQVYYYLKKKSDFEIVDVAYRSKLTNETILLDVTDKAKVTELILSIKPHIIINCIGVLIKKSNNNLANAIYINSFLPHLLANLSDRTGSKLIHISTDCVFSGEKGRYSEDDFKDGIGNYSRSKALGELVNSRDLTLRTSIIGPEIKNDGEGLFSWFISQSGQINGYTNVYWSGVTTLELARVIKQSIEQNLTGLYNVTNGKSISKHELLLLLQKYFNPNIKINPICVIPKDKTLVDTRNELKIEIFDYPEMVLNLKCFIEQNKHLYPFNMLSFLK